MLCLGRKQGQSVKVSGPCEIVVNRVAGGGVQLGFIAENHVTVNRSEIEKKGVEEREVGT